jgi:DNA polymerase III subunit alpha, Gram-positive type
LSNSFSMLVSQLHMSAEDRRTLTAAVIERVCVDTNSKMWHVSMKVIDPVTEEGLQVLREALCNMYGLSSIKFDIKCLKKYVTLGEYLTERWDAVIEIIIEHIPSLQGWLKTARYTILDESHLEVELNNCLALEIIKQKRCEQHLERILQSELGRAVQVHFTAGEDGETCNLFEEFQQQVEQQLQVVVADKPSSGKSEKRTSSEPLFGRVIKEEAAPIESIKDEERKCVVAGRIFTIDVRELRSGRQLVTFDMTDLTDSISVKVFLEEKDKSGLPEKLKKDMWVKVRGPVQHDKFTQELTIMADSIVPIPAKEERMDRAAKKRVELHCHTRMSTLDSVCSTDSLIARVAKWGHSAVAITDHGVVQAFPEAHESALKHGVKILYGLEGYFTETGETSARHIIIMAQNYVGLKNLYQIISASHIKYYHRTPRIPRDLLVRHREGLIIGSACEAGELFQAILQGALEEKLEKIAAFYDYLEIQPIANNFFLLREGKVASEEHLRDINRKICEIALKLNKPVVATGDVHFLDPQDEVYRRILMAGKGFSDSDDQPPLYLRTTEEMLDEFSYLGAELAYKVVVEYPQCIANLMEEIKPFPDEFFPPVIEDAEEQIKTMSYARAKELYGDPLPELIEERLKFELNGIINNGFAVLYLIAHKLVKKSLDDGYLVGSRGSVGSSFVATMCYITEVNPLSPHWRCNHCLYHEFVLDGSYGGGFDLPDKDCPQCSQAMFKDGHDIPFAVFMGFHGDKVPDIDLNFSGEYQSVAHRYTEELFGKENVYRAGTIATVAEKTAYGFVKGYLNERNMQCRSAEINRLVSGCAGVKRTTGQHPGGVMVIPKDRDVHEFTPIQRPADDQTSDTITTHFDYHSISGRLVKLDILGHDDPTVIKMLEDLTGVNARTIPLDESQTMKLFSSTDSLGLTPEQLGAKVGTFAIPEFGTKFVRQMLEDTQPKTFSQLVRISGFSHGTDVWLNNAQNLIKDGTAKLSEAISARDDIMVYLIHKGVEPGKAFKIMESVRKGKGVKPEDAEDMRKNNVPEWYVESCQKIKYMFPKAHAVAYVMMAFRIAWFKVYHPAAFYATYFTVRATDFDAQLITQGEYIIRTKMTELERKGNAVTAKEKSLLTILEVALEMILRGIPLKKVDLYNSDATKFLIEKDGLLPPLASLQGLGENAANNIVSVRGELPFSSLEDLRNRARVSKTVIEILRDYGCLHHMPESDQTVLFG